MASITQTNTPRKTAGPAIHWADYFPGIQTLRNYRREDLPGDLIAGVIVAVMLIPQGMAYAVLAGLPPQMGLYASILPLVIYGLLGTSRTLAVGPVAIVSLLTASGVSAFAAPLSPEYIRLTLTLALMIAIIQTAMGFFRAGFLVNFLSHPVLSGFTSAAALIIGASQLRAVLGLDLPRQEHFYETIWVVIEHLGQVHLPTLWLSLGGIGILMFFKHGLPRLLRAAGVADGVIAPLTRTGPLVIVALGAWIVARWGLDVNANVAIVGTVPAGFPALTLPSFNPADWQMLLPVALTISFVGYMESIAVARSLASKRRQKIDANQELIGLGAANIGAAFTGGFPVTGGLARSVVNFSAGANTGLASIITAGLVALTVMFLTGWFYYVPSAALAVIVLMAVFNLFDFATFRHTWAYSRAEGVSLLVTFLAVLGLGIETGILVGAAAALGFYLYRTSRPHYAIVGRIQQTEHYRNVNRHEVETYAGVVALRIDESLYFPNAQYIEDVVEGIVAGNPNLNHLVLICSAVNFIDSSALHVLEDLYVGLKQSGVNLCLAEVKGPVMDRLRKAGFIDKIGEDCVFLSTHQAMTNLCDPVA